MIGARRPGASESPATVLLVDDDPDRVDRLRGLLERAGYGLFHGVDGAAGLRLVSAHASDLVLCQTQLPDMDGLDVCKAIKQAPTTQDVPVVMLIDGDDDVQRQRALQAGADDVCPMPIDSAVLLAIIRSQVHIGRLTAQLNELEGAVLTLARAVEDRDHTSSGLAEKVAHWAMQLGTAVGLSREQLTLLYKAALLHDVGTVSVPVAVLTKDARLDPGEFNQVKRHPIVGEEILRALPRSAELLAAVRHHHERMDGAGYPDGLGGEAIPLFARIIAIADAYVAMTSDRAYRRRRPREDAIKTLQQGAGKQWDAELVESFVPLVEATDAEAASRLKTG